MAESFGRVEYGRRVLTLLLLLLVNLSNEPKSKEVNVNNFTEL